MLDREDWLDFQKRKQKDKANGETFPLEFLAQAQVRMEHLTGNQDWDRFLSYLEGHNTRLKEGRDHLRDVLCSPELVDQGEIMQAKTALARVGGMIDMLEAVLQLPKDIIETGEKAKEKLSSLK